MNLLKNKFGIGINGFVCITVYVIGIIILLFVLFSLKKIHLIDFYYALTIWSGIYTVILNIMNSISETKRKKLDKAIEIVNNFDNLELRKARDFTRLFKKEHDENNLPKGNLAKFIENGLDEKKQREWMEKYKIAGEEDLRELKSSLVYLFNYFQSVYAILKSDMADKDYVLKSLSCVYTQLFDRFESWIREYCKTSDKYQYEDLESLKTMADSYLEQNPKGQKG